MKKLYNLFFLLFSVLKINTMELQSPSTAHSPQKRSSSCTDSPKAPRSPIFRVIKQDCQFAEQIANGTLGASKSTPKRSESLPKKPPIEVKS